MNERNHLLWIRVGTDVAYLIGLLTILFYLVINKVPALVEIASVTWNNGPLL